VEQGSWIDKADGAVAVALGVAAGACWCAAGVGLMLLGVSCLMGALFNVKSRRDGHEEG